MKNRIRHGLIAAAVATALGAGSAAAQVQSKTIQVGSNCTMTVTTSVLTNGGAVITGGTGVPLDPQIILKALVGNGCGSVTASGGAMDPKAVMQIISSVTASASMDTNPVTWLGLAADEVSEDVRAQLPLPAGAGLLVRHVTQDGPAAQAGVLQNDVLVRLDDQLLVNAAQLRALIRGKKDGEKTTLSLLRKGKDLQVSAKLAKKAQPEDEAGLSQAINLGAFHPDLNHASGRMGGSGGPVVFHKTFTVGGATNSASRLDIRAILEAVSNAMQQAQRELNAPAK